MYLKLRVIAEAKEERVEKMSDDHWNVWVRQKAERNLANSRVVEIVREGFPGTSIKIVSGHHSPSKIVSIG